MNSECRVSGVPFIEVNQDDETISVYGHTYSFGFFKAMAINRECWIHVDKHGTFRPYGDLIMPVPDEPEIVGD